MTPTRGERLLLAFDTSTARGSVAVGLPGEVLGRVFLEDQRAHAAELVPGIASAMELSGVDLSELTGVVVGAGPGSFTGVRVAAATAKGLSHALGLPLWSFSSLVAAAATADAIPAEGVGRPSEATTLPTSPGLASFPRCVLFDARADRVYAACYRFGEGAPETLLTPRATDLATLLETVRALDTDVAFAGDGAQKHQETIQDAGFPLLGPPAGEPTGDGLLHLMALDPHARPLENPGRWTPDYLRASNAEREKNR